MMRRMALVACALVSVTAFACDSSHEIPDASADAPAQLDAAGSPFGGPCAVDADCALGLQCLTHFYMNLPECPTDSPPYDLPGGYCSVLNRYRAGTMPLPACPGVGSFSVVVAACAEPTTVPDIEYCAGHCESDADCRTPAYFCEPTQSICLPDLRAHLTP